MKYSRLKSAKNYYKSDIPADSGLHIDFGDRGCGKSANIAKTFYLFKRDHEKNKGYYNQYTEFYSNVSFKIEDDLLHFLDLTHFKLTDYLDPNDNLFSKYNVSTYNSVNPAPYFIKKNSIICIDELGIIAHSREFKNFPQQFVSLMKILRKAGILLLTNSQDYSVDKAIRQAADLLTIRRKFLNFSYSRRINKWIDINRGEDSESDTQIINKIDFAPIFQKDSIKICYIPFYVDLYDSFL